MQQHKRQAKQLKFCVTTVVIVLPQLGQFIVTGLSLNISGLIITAGLCWFITIALGIGTEPGGAVAGCPYWLGIGAMTGCCPYWLGIGCIAAGGVTGCTYWLGIGGGPWAAICGSGGWLAIKGSCAVCVSGLSYMGFPIGKDEIKKDKDKNKDKEEEPQQNEMQYSHTLEETMEKYLIQKMPDNSKEDANFKILFLGDSGVGKSSLVIRGIKKEFDSCYKPTVGFDLINYVVKINDKIIKLQIWDTCGQEEFSMCNQSLYKNATMAVMVYSIISKKSYNNIKKWVNHAKDLSNENIIFFLVGNKCDLYNEREVSFNDAKRYSKDFKFFVETSSKFGNNVDNLFKKIVIYLYENIVKTEFDENNDSKNEEFITEGSSSFLDSHILQIEGKKKCLKCC